MSRVHQSLKGVGRLVARLWSFLVGIILLVGSFAFTLLVAGGISVAIQGRHNGATGWSIAAFVIVAAFWSAYVLPPLLPRVGKAYDALTSQP